MGNVAGRDNAVDVDFHQTHPGLPEALETAKLTARQSAAGTGSSVIDKRLVCAIVAGLLFVADLNPATAQDAGEMQVHFGRQSYRLFCAGCHGADGRGSGSVADALAFPVGDLTAIARDNGGVFPAAEVAAAIAGSSDVSGHKRLAIQPWSRMFADEFEQFAAEMAVNQLVARRIDHLVVYLESIQR